MRACIIFLVLFLCAEAAQSAVFHFTESEDVGGSSRLFEKLDDLLADFNSPPKKPKLYVAGKCLMRVAKVECLRDKSDGGYSYALRAVPFMPSALLSYIQEGRKISREEFVYKREKFLKRARNFRFTGDESLIAPVDNDWAVSEHSNWIDGNEDPDAARIKMIWDDIENYSYNSKISESGLFIIRVNHLGGIKSKQVCWYFFNFSDNTVPKCKAFLIEKDGKIFVRYIRAIYEGGYSYEPPLSFSCVTDRGKDGKQNIDAYSAEIGRLFKAKPFSADGARRIRGGEEELRGMIFVSKSSGVSSIFPKYRETFFVEVDIMYSGDGNVEIHISPDVFITKQNVSLLTEISGPSFDQDKYFKGNVRDAMLRSGKCTFNSEFSSEEL